MFKKIFDNPRAKFENSIIKIISKINSKSNNSLKVMLDATWDNPNYWYRYVLLKTALGFIPSNVTGVIGQFNRERVTATLKRFKIFSIEDLLDNAAVESDNKILANEYINSINCHSDILKLSLPYNLPAEFLYDYILKKQRNAFVDIHDKELLNDVHYFLNCISISNKIIQSNNPDLIISSHAVGYYIAFVWVALYHGKKVIVPYGDHGLLRFWQIESVEHIFNFQDRPQIDDLYTISNEQRRKLSIIGKQYLQMRMDGATCDLGAVFAYKNRADIISKKELCEQFGWHKETKIVAVYASNWFDYPHGLGMNYFVDFYDWMMSVIEVIKSATHINWILKSHPCDEWYGGVTLEEMINLERYQHIKFASKLWNGDSIVSSVDAIITYHGTIGIEATAKKKPVLVVEKGWYGGWNFVKVATSRDHFLNLLNENWWEDMDTDANAELVAVFAGWYWGKPFWQHDYLLEDDSMQWKLYESLPILVKNNINIAKIEIDCINSWFNSQYQHYHTYKMIKADNYIP